MDSDWGAKVRSKDYDGFRWGERRSTRETLTDSDGGTKVNTGNNDKLTYFNLSFKT